MLNPEDVNERGAKEMGHIGTDELISYVEGKTSDVDKMTLESHVTSCGECAELKREFENLLHLLIEDASFEPPAELVQFGIDLFQPVARQRTGQGIRKFI